MITQLIIMLNIVDVVWPTIKKLNKYENVSKFNTNWPAFNLVWLWFNLL